MDFAKTTRDENLPCLEEILADYLDEVDSGRTVDELEWLDRYPTLRGELSAFFRDHRVVKSAVDQSSSGSRVGKNSNGNSPEKTDEKEGAPHTDDPLETVGSYELIREIGRGGMGIVYEAHQPGLSRNVALKMLRHAGAASEEDFGRLRNEAESIARLNHPAIIAVHDTGSNEGQFWFTMQLIRGNNLNCFADRFQTEPRDAVRIVEEIAQAIEHAHRRGILHRDLKPGNILLDEQNQPHVSDFGLARRVDYDSSLTQTGAILGTPSYLAPEQLTDPRGVTTAVDIYGLGAILYFLLTGRPPVVADTLFEAIDKVRNESIDPPSRSNRRISKDLDAICARCLEKQPEDRYRSADELVQDLRRVLEGSPVEARVISSWERLNRWRRRNPGMARLAECVIGLTMLLVIGSTTAAIMLNRANREATESLEQVTEAKRELEFEKQSTLRNLYEARKQQALAARFSGRPGQRVEAIKAAQEAASLITPLSLPDGERLGLRNIQIAAMQLVDLVNDQGRRLGMVSPDGRQRLNIEEDRRTLLITDLQSGRLLERLVIRGPGQIDWHRPMCAWFSHEGRYLAARVLDGDTGIIQLWKLGQSEPVLISDRATSRGSTQYAFSPDEKHVGFVIDGRLKVHKLADGEEVLNMEMPGKVGLCFAYHSNHLAAFGGGGIVILDILTGEAVREFETIEGVRLANWTPDDRMLVGSLNNKSLGKNDLHLWDAVNGTYRVLSGHSSNIEFFEIHPRGDMVVTSSWDGTLRLWSLCGCDQRLQLDGFFYDFSRDGRRLRIRTQDGPAHWRVELPEEFRELSPPSVLDVDGNAINQKMRGIAIHPDGRLMLGGNVKALISWDLASGQSVASEGRSGSDAQFSPDGRRLFTAGSTHGEIYVQSVDKQETDAEVIYTIGTPSRVGIGIERSLAAKPVSQGRVHDRSGQGTSLPTFGTRWKAPDSSGKIFLYDMHRLCLIPVQGKQRRLSYPAVSPNGELLAVGHWNGPDTHVWDVRSGKLVKTFETALSKVAFSPDGQMLAINEPGHCTVYEVGSWKTLYQSSEEVSSHTIARAVTFSPDNSMLAFDPGSRRDIRLLSTRNFQEIANMHLPDGTEMVDHIDFSPDSSKLIESSGDVVQIWDLRLIREQLGELDWDLPPFSAPKYDPPKPMRVRFAPINEQEN